MAPYIGYDSDTTFIPGTLNTSSSLFIQGGGLTQTGGDVSFDSGTLFIDEDVNRVGIGITNPTEKLHVYSSGAVASVNIDSSNSGSTVYYCLNGVRQYTTEYVPASNFYSIGRSGVAYDFNLKNGNVGIGTTNPNNKLHVTQNIRISDTSNPYLVLYDGTNTGYLQIASTVLDLYHNGNISFSPGQSVKALLDSTGRFMVGQQSPYGASGGGNSIGSFAWNGNFRTNFAINNQTNGADAGAALVLASYGQDWVIEGGSILKNSKALTIKSSTTEVIRVDSSGNIGIGTTIPFTKLDTRGALHVGGGSDGIWLGNVGDNSAYDNVKIYYTGYNSGAPRIYLTPRTQPGSGTINTYLHLLSNNVPGPGANNMGLLVDGNVGIGTTNPGTKLDVYGDIAINGTFAIRRTDYGYSSTYKSVFIGSPNSVTNTVSLCVDVSTISGGNFHGQNQVIIPPQGLLVPNQAGTNFIGILSRDINDSIRIGPSISAGIGDGPITITNTSVGISTTNPGAKLHVQNGGILVKGASAPNLNLTPTDGLSGNGDISFDGTNFTIVSNSSGANLVLGTYSTPRLTINSSGNVGIGTTNPIDKLHIYSSAVVYNTIESGASTNVGVRLKNTLSDWYIINDSNGELQFYKGDIKLLIDSTGNIGIGTNDPQYKLEVNGSFAATTKSFIIEHPTKEGYKLRHGSLEGPENGVYVRGRSTDPIIHLPGYWVALVDADSITITLTPIGSSGVPRVERIENNKVYIFSEDSRPLDYFYMVNAERVDVAPLEVEIPPTN
jgi:hypothetical protein